MDKKKVFNQIRESLPPLVYLSGKTCTGKSTFAKELVTRLGYLDVELDAFVLKDVIKKFNLKDEGKVFDEVYKNRTEKEWIESFTHSVNSLLKDKVKAGKKIVVEGAAANVDVFKEIFEGFESFTFIYFHPYKTGNYLKYLTNRFMTATENYNAGLPTTFWELIDQKDFIRFCKTRDLSDEIKETIKIYAEQSRANSEKRLKYFQSNFDDILVVEV